MKAHVFRFVTLGLGSLLVASTGCSSRSEAEPRPAAAATQVAPVAVKRVAATAIKVPRVLTLSGTLIGSEEAQVAAGAAGKVLATYVERGSVVKKGAVLAQARLARRWARRPQEAAAQVEIAEGAAGAGDARLRAHRADVREGRDLQGRLRPRAAPSARRPSGRWRPPRRARRRSPRRCATPRSARRSRAWSSSARSPRASTCGPTRASSRWSTSTRCASS